MTINLSALQQQRRDTAANWTSQNPTLLAGEIGYETDTGYIKVGDGSTAWTSLAYIHGTKVSAYPLATVDIADDAITAAKLADTAVTAGSYTAADITVDAQGRITAAASGTIGTSEIADDAVTGDKLANDITIANDLTVTNNLTVNGTTTTIDTTTLTVEDKNIELGTVATPSDTTADGGGITLKGATDKTLTWVNSTDCWTFNQSLNLPAGSASAPALILNGDTNTGIYSPGADQLAISTNGTGRLFVNSSGTVTVSSAALNFGTGGTSGFISANNYYGATSSDWFFNTGHSSQDFVWKLNTGTELARLDSSGNFVIGASTANSKFHVKVGTNQNIAFNSDGSNSRISAFNDAASASVPLVVNGSDLRLTTSGTERMRIDSSGRLLLGASSSVAPNRLFQIAGSNMSVCANTANSDGVTVDYIKSRNTSYGSNTIVQSGDTIAKIQFRGDDGSDYLTQAAQIAAEVDGTPGSNDMPGRLVFSTTADGASTPTERMRIDSSGKVGIGTTSPSSILHLDAGTGDTRLNIEGGTNGDGTLALAGTGSGISKISFWDQLAIGKTSGGVGDIASEYLRIDSSGRLLVGLSSDAMGNLIQSASTGGNNFAAGRFAANTGGPDIVLRKSRNATVGSHTIVQDDDDLGNIFWGGSNGSAFKNAARISAQVDATPGTGDDMPGRLTFYTSADGSSSPTERMRIDRQGRVGINDTTPDARLDIGGDDADIRLGGSQYFRIKALSTGELTFNDNDVNERMRIDSSGNIGIGANSINNSYGTNVNIHTTTTNGARLKISDGTSGNGNVDGLDIIHQSGIAYIIQRENNDLRFSTNNTEHFRIASNGDLTATDTTIGSNSDSRLKTNIADFAYDLEAFKQYQPKTFDWKNPELHGNKTSQRGFIAQDVEAIDDYWVSQQAVDEDSADAEFLDADRLAKTLKLDKKDAMYVSVIQQLLAKVETLEAKVAALEAQ